ncbi:MAG TPA: hypothetical protein VFJ76_07655 [Solirubrobacterales bacterium]|nr:hypothetical protein [Solirubrobacterales bacterium]
MASNEDIKQLDAEVQQDEIADLKRIAEGFGLTFDGDEYSNDELLRLGIGIGIPGALSDEQVRREAAEILSELEGAS